MKVNDWKIMENSTREFFLQKMPILSFCCKIIFIGQGILRCLFILRELMEKLPDWGLRQILHLLDVFT